jgi:hypothetical protein
VNSRDLPRAHRLDERGRLRDDAAHARRESFGQGSKRDRLSGEPVTASHQPSTRRVSSGEDGRPSFVDAPGAAPTAQRFLDRRDPAVFSPDSTVFLPDSTFFSPNRAVFQLDSTVFRPH